MNSEDPAAVRASGSCTEAEPPIQGAWSHSNHAIPDPLPPPIPERGFFRILDALLRNREGFFDAIFEGRDIGVRIRSFLMAALILLAFYGLTMGLIGFRKSWDQGLMQTLASGIKVPLLFLLTTAVCFPLLYIVQVLMGARLAFTQTLCLILMGITVNGLLLAGCAPIGCFFLVTGSGYDFLKLLHVLMMAFSGVWAMASLWYGLRRMCEKSSLYPPIALRILQVWILIFGFVGSQMAWSLRPFVGAPDRPFTMFRKQEGNFYMSLWHSATSVGRAPERTAPAETSQSETNL